MPGVVSNTPHGQVKTPVTKELLTRREAEELLAEIYEQPQRFQKPTLIGGKIHVTTPDRQRWILTCGRDWDNLQDTYDQMYGRYTNERI